MENSVVLRIPRPIFHRVLAEFPKDAARIRAKLAARTRQMSQELERLRANALDPPDSASRRLRGFEGLIRPPLAPARTPRASACMKL